MQSDKIEQYPLNWESVLVEDLNTSKKNGNIYLIPFISSDMTKLTKIGKGSSYRILEVIKSAKEAGLDINGQRVFVCLTKHSWEAERFLHRRFLKKRINRAYGFKGGTELFAVSIQAIKRVKNFEFSHVEKFIPTATIPRKDSCKGYTSDGLCILALHQKIRPESIKAGLIDLRLTHKTKHYEPCHGNSLHTIGVDWYSFTGQQPFEFLGNPTKESDSWIDLCGSLEKWQSNMSSFFSQWRLTNDGYFALIHYLSENEFISTKDLYCKFLVDPSRSIRVADSEWAHPTLRD